jgi:hypothetical protein
MEFITIKHISGEYTLKKSDIYLIKKRNAYKAKCLGGLGHGESIDFPDRFYVEMSRSDEASFDEIEISEEEYKNLLSKLIYARF